MRLPGFLSSNKREEARINGGRNLLILGFGAALIAFITTAVSLKIYHDTGDIYIDRSRPGFISETEKDESQTSNESFSEDGEVTREDIEEYTRMLLEYRKKIDARANDFTRDSLSDVQLNLEIEEEFEAEQDTEY